MDHERNRQGAIEGVAEVFGEGKAKELFDRAMKGCIEVFGKEKAKELFEKAFEGVIDVFGVEKARELFEHNFDLSRLTDKEFEAFWKISELELKFLSLDDKEIEIFKRLSRGSKTRWGLVGGLKITQEEEADFEGFKELEVAQKVMAGRKRSEEGEVDLARYAPLCRDVLYGNWPGVEEFIWSDRTALTASITENYAKILHLMAALPGEANWLTEKLVTEMSSESLESTDFLGQTALFLAAMTGNTKAAEIMVGKNGNLPNIMDVNQRLPLHRAAMFGHGETVQYLLSVTKAEGHSNPFTGEMGVQLVGSLIIADLYGIALDLLRQYPDLCREQNNYRKRVLNVLVRKTKGFPSGTKLGYWQRLIYHYIPVEEHIPSPKVDDGDVENPGEISKAHSATSTLASTIFGSRGQKFHIVFWNTFKQLAASINRIHDTKLIHIQICQIVRLMCEGETWTLKDTSESFRIPVLTATRLGIHEFVNEVIMTNPQSMDLCDSNGRGIFQLAVLSRQDKVFNLIHDKPLKELGVIPFRDKDGNNILHMAAILHLSTKVPGAALQMQRELQWFKAVENFVHPLLREERNNDKRTPRELFTQQHEKLVEKAEKWMKDTASSCTFVAALITTVVFAAVFTVPGGNDSQGIPIFLNHPSFKIFAISDALALFSSSTSVLMFSGILTARYSEEDFLESLPKKLIFGLITLFFSIAAMMVAFGATLHMVLVHPLKWTIIPVALLACLPVTSFARLQFPLLVEMFTSTYGPSIIQPPPKKYQINTKKSIIKHVIAKLKRCFGLLSCEPKTDRGSETSTQN